MTEQVQPRHLSVMRKQPWLWSPSTIYLPGLQATSERIRCVRAAPPSLRRIQVNSPGRVEPNRRHGVRGEGPDLLVIPNDKSNVGVPVRGLFGLCLPVEAHTKCGRIAS